MNTSTSIALQHYLHSHSLIYVTTTTSIVAVIVLLLLAVEREIIRFISPSTARRNVATFAVVIIPTLLVFATVVIDRFVQLS